jgi:hypothetical protein
VTSPSSPDVFAARLRLAATATGGSKPQVATALANSDLEDGQIQMVGGFTQALDTATLTRLARLSGAQTNLDPTQKSQLDGIGEDYSDVNKPDDADPRNALEKVFDNIATGVSNTGQWLSDNPVTGKILDGLDFLNDVAHLPARLLSDALDGGGNQDERETAMRAKGYDPNSAWDYVQFMTMQGDSLYHDLDGIRNTYGDDMVDLAIEAQSDPEGFNERLASKPQHIQDLVNSPEFADAADKVNRQHISPGRDLARILTLGHTDNAAFTAISGALDGAYTVLLDPTLLAGKVTAGVRALDAAGNATRELGRLDRARGVGALTRAADRMTGGYYRSGLRDAVDQDGIRSLLGAKTDEFGNVLRDPAGRVLPATAAGRTAQGFLDSAARLRGAADDAERASIYADMQTRFRAYMPFLDEVNGSRVLPSRAKAADEFAAEPGVADAVAAGDAPAFDRKIVDANGRGWLATNGKPIESLDEFADYMANTTGFLRFAGGAAAKRELMLPGRVRLSTRASAWNASRRAERGVAANDEAYVFDHAKPYTIFPNEAEESIQARLDAVEREQSSGVADAGLRGDAIFAELRKGTAQGHGWHPIRKAAAKWEQRARRVSSLMPTVSAIDLTAADGTEQVRRFARLYMNKAEADRLASVYALGDLGQRRQIVNGIIEQTFHASGLSRSEGGLREIEKFRADQDGLHRRAYGLNGFDVLKSEAGDRHVALYPSQLSEHVLIPDFRSLQYLATKHVVGGHVARKTGAIRAGFTGDRLDELMGIVKAGWITSAAGGTRNALDEVAGGIAQGLGTDMLRGRQLLSQVTKTDRATSLAERRAAAAVEGRLGPRIPLFLRGQADRVNNVLVAGVLGKLLSYTKLADLDEHAVRYAGELADDLHAGLVRDSITTTHYADDALKTWDNDGALGLHGQGLMASQVKLSGDNVKSEFGGWRQVEIDGGQGLDNWVDGLGQRFQDLTSPAHVALRAILDGDDALTRVVEYMHTAPMRHFVEHAEMLQTTRAGKRVVTDADQLEAIERYAENMIADVTLAVAGRGKQIASADEAAGAAARWEHELGNGFGPVNAELADMLLKGQIPDRAWLKANLAPEEIPLHATGRVFLPVNPKHMVGKLAAGYTSILSKAYGKVVTDQVNAISRNPMLTAAYVQARKHIAPYEEHLTAAGFTPEVAEKLTRDMARSHAEQLVIKSIDNPQVATQFSIVARNFWAFERAQEDWLRRWGRIIRDHPESIRKGQLAIHGAVSAGLVEQDDQGNLQFVYPGSGLVINAFTKLVSKLPGMPDMVNVPVMPDLTSQLTFLNPSLDNPIGFSGTPVISIPFKLMSATLGADHPLITSSMDKVINGDMGAGRAWYEQMLPSWANRIIGGVLSDDPASQFGSAYTNALVNLEAAGRLDQLTGTDPTAMARFQNDLKAQVANQMVARALFGFFAPASPSGPTNDVVADYRNEIAAARERGDEETAAKLEARDGQSVLTPDWSAHHAGIASLKDEYRQAVSKLGYEQAQTWWAANHPGELIFAHSARTEVGDSDAYAPATLTAAKWMQDNKHLLDNYGGKGGIATYFMPQGTPGTTGGEYSDVAYRAQLEQGIREYKSLDDYFEQIVTQRGEAIYYDSKDDYDAEIAAATAQHDMARVAQLQDEWAQQKQLIYATNPLLAAKNAEYATSGVGQQQKLQQLNGLLADPTAVASLGDQAAGVAQLMLAQRQFTAGTDAVKGQRGYVATAQRQSLRHDYQSAINQVLARWPGLEDLARGVFRVPD